jgi:hypothetical protein
MLLAQFTYQPPHSRKTQYIRSSEKICVDFARINPYSNTINALNSISMNKIFEAAYAGVEET